MYKKIAAVLATCVLATLGLVGIATADDDKYNCDDFRYQEDAQAVYNQDRSDPNDLDRDNDGIACETLPHRPKGSSGGSDSGKSNDDSNSNSRQDADDNGGIRLPSLIHTGGGATA
ncbi:excalibur calcium-binding domain-containing protein [Actinopolymorpha singaporensis]|uniref:Excalibur calcium-binding domain-containing protein n=1 Tax=Actinopolymorpha singaporensis TaxID=117157 RepID=A0A1H1M3R4_9ACTN|nr:excalibur calcium-binding domain-containing protein [Actinopolymorpha singaporensis]SDR81327.1 Excalibur calcium-binding domain-containing protein [Actinopolymorpha singaporensis]